MLFNGVLPAPRTIPKAHFCHTHAPDFFPCVSPVPHTGDDLMMMVEGLDELESAQEAAPPPPPPPPPPETPAAMGERLAREAFPTSYRIDKRKMGRRQRLGSRSSTKTMVRK